MFNRLHRMIICFSLLIAVAIFFIYLKHKQYLPLLLLISIVCAYVLSSFITGALSNPNNRYGSRIIWLLPFFSFASLIHFINFWTEYFRRSPRTGNA
jgi:glycerol uptake facilitator-like aquaporin